MNFEERLMIAFWLFTHQKQGHTHTHTKEETRVELEVASRRVPICTTAVVTAISWHICLVLLLSSGGPTLSVIPPCLLLTCGSYGIKEAGTQTRPDCVQLLQDESTQLSSQKERASISSWKERMTSTAHRLAHQQEREQGIGTNKRAVKFAKQDYETLRQQCLKRGCLFEDNCFPAEHKSLGYNELGPYSSKTRGVVWKRPQVRCNYQANKHCFYTVSYWLV